MDPPSPQLVERLIGSGLCRPRDLRKCRARVRRLARDIPAFETVWLDALVQIRALTAFQADVLGSDTPDQLTVGPFLLINRAGDDGRFLHYQARRRDNATRFLLSVAHGEFDSPVAAEERLRRFLQRTAVVSHSGLASLTGFEVVDGRLWVASPWTVGPTLQQLLVRRGRFPPRAVATVAWQICDAVAALETVGSLHGDLRARHIVMTPRGQTALLIPGMRAALFPERTIHADVPPDDCDGVAPELIGVGQSPSTASEMYAVGCLLWELLAGRPPFPHGDPLAKLAAHQSQPVPDIRDWAPETPATLAELILELTRRNPSARPQSFRELAARLQQFGRASRRELATIAQGTAAALPADPAGDDGARAGAKTLAAAVLLVAAGSVVLLNSGVRTELLSIAQRTPPARAATPPTTETETPSEPQAPQLLPLPPPNEAGVIELRHPGPYAAGDVASGQRVVIRSTSGDRAVILIENQPLRISSRQTVLDHVELRRSSRTDGEDSPAGPLVQVDSLEFAIQHCWLDNGDSPQQPAVSWKPPEKSSTSKSRTIIRQTVFAGAGPALLTHGFPAEATFENVLQSGPGALLELSTPSHVDRDIDIVARRVTVRGVTPLVSVRLLAGESLPRSLALTLEECVAELDQSALVEFSALEAPDDWPRRLRITGEGSVVRPGSHIVGLRNAPDRLRPLPTGNVSIEGLLAADFDFAGVANGPPQNSVITGFAGYGRSARPPGIDPAGLPASILQTYNSTAPERGDAAPRDSTASTTSPRQ